MKPSQLKLKGMKPKRKKPIKRKKAKKVKPKSLRDELEALQKAIVIKVYGTACYTCPAKDLQGSNCQLGHVPWPRSQLSIPSKFDTRFTRIQCYKCNIWDKGRGADAAMKMLKEGIDLEMMWAENVAEKGKTFNNKWFVGKIADYTLQLHG